MTGKAPQRVRVTGPVRGVRPRRSVPDPTGSTTKIHQEITPLVRAQLRSGLILCGSVCGPLVALPLLFAYVPALGVVSLWGIPLPWWLLGVLVYPVMVLAGWLYVRRAERNERDFLRRMESP